LKANYNYATVPKLDPDAFLLAGVTDWEALKLLKGPANVFFEGTYLGKTYIDPNTAGDTLELSLGRDKDVNVARNLVKDFSKKQFLGTNNILDRSWEITVRNNKGQKISLIIEDQFPLSKDEEIQIEYLEYEGAKFDEKTGMLQWPVVLNPKEEVTVHFRYRVKYPKKLKLFLNN
jgi:uncharacterized protein (TIGR02231 family)